jgi:hypothetical protein
VARDAPEGSGIECSGALSANLLYSRYSTNQPPQPKGKHMKFKGFGIPATPMPLADRVAYLKDHPLPEDKDACNEAVSDVMHELRKVSRRIKFTATDLIRTEYATARAEQREPSVDIRSILLTAWDTVITTMSADREPGQA